MDNTGYAASIVGTVFGAVIAGALIGLIPFFLGRKWGKQLLGTIGFVVCIFCNFLMGLLLSVPACLVFVIILLLTRKGR